MGVKNENREYADQMFVEWPEPLHNNNQDLTVICKYKQKHSVLI